MGHVSHTNKKMINKILIDETGNRYYWSKGDLSTHLGIIKEGKIKKAKSDVKSNLGKKFLVLKANFLDNIHKIKKGTAMVNLKDIGAILVYAGIDKESAVLEAGSGSGQLTSFLARFAKKVYSYEKNKDYYNLTKKNLEFLDIKNVELKNLDIKKSRERNIDLVVLDLLDPWNYAIVAKKALKKSGYLAAYLTNVNQITELVKNLNGFILERIINIKEENWISKGIVLRPEHWSLSHTAFLLFARKR
ncbi:MAG: tRNA (Adenine-57, 58-N(1)-) methyltransferase [archaeon GW2011_AR20]|nr:MAG: tRNA (Adenine-57, 58-N(1)-) methyltransferase [archaeon GW2011_AR20]